MRRFIYIVLDGVGIGALTDAADYGDEGADTLGNLSRIVSLRLPFLGSLGLGNIAPLQGVPPVAAPLALTARLAPCSVGKDSTVGHWEQMGVVTKQPFPTYPQGFPPELMDKFTRAIGRGVLGNRAASGTEIISELGNPHVVSGEPIVYTSADSVFQIAAHVDVVPLELLYSWCETARELLVGDHAVARVIARPFGGSSGSYARRAGRRDYSLPPPGPTYLAQMVARGVQVVALGKISELFAGQGISRAAKFASNEQNLTSVAEMLAEAPDRTRSSSTLIITNLVDFDTVWGHRNDVVGFANGLEKADSALASIAAALRGDDCLLVTADHGVDPTTASTDHSREYVPALLYPRPQGAPDATYEGWFADAGATAFEHLTNEQAELEGRSLLALEPGRGWRRFTPVQRSESGTVAGLPGRVGPEETSKAAMWLARNLGSAPEAAVVLGSGLHLEGLGAQDAEIGYASIPGWGLGDVEGHPSSLALGNVGGQRLALLKGRVHEYEGFDLSEVQLPIRSLAAWGVRKLILSCAAGAVAEKLRPGTVVLVDWVVDAQYRDPDSRPVRLVATPLRLLEAVGATTVENRLSAGTHASVPGPQYETGAELRALREMGVATVSMSPAGELRAALDEGLAVAVLALVTNVGETKHDKVLAAAEQAGGALCAALQSVLRAWV